MKSLLIMFLGLIAKNKSNESVFCEYDAWEYFGLYDKTGIEEQWKRL